MDGDSRIELDGDQRALVERLVDSGRFEGLQDVVNAGLRLLDAEERRWAALREAIREGEESGPPVPFDVDEFLGEVRAETDING